MNGVRGALHASCGHSSGVTLLDGALVCATCRAPIVAGSSSAAVIYTQRDTSRPPGTGRPKFLRTHARALEANDRGTWCEGRTRLMTAEAWARWSRTQRPKPRPPAPSAEEKILAELGGKRAGT